MGFHQLVALVGLLAGVSLSIMCAGIAFRQGVLVLLGVSGIGFVVYMMSLPAPDWVGQ